MAIRIMLKQKKGLRYHTVPAGSRESPVVARLPLILVLLLSEGAPVVTVSPCVLLPPRTNGTSRLLEPGAPHLPPKWLLETALTPGVEEEMLLQNFYICGIFVAPLTLMLGISYRSSQLWLRCISRTLRPKPPSASSILLW